MDQYLGEIRMFGGNFAPIGWALCNGQTLSISENEALYSLIGTTYGGDGVQTFVLPDLRGRAPIHQGQGNGLTNRVMGQTVGTESVTLNTQQMPAHSHGFNSFNNYGTAASPAQGFPAKSTDAQFNGTPNYATSTNGLMNAASVQPSGGTQPHENFQPTLAINYIIATTGVYPTQG
ncbi:phage tail protein [Taibaiella soli]|uniref:Phage tail protein n=1 Tax=Taibaiella soli TaxID=1649169 RepID=A0A2W2ALM0_9BACT|nr:tail fiber protein [Taibaiella soli]PZF74452.1 phage tail protein [Taibaiella soli]